MHDLVKVVTAFTYIRVGPGASRISD